MPRDVRYTCKQHGTFLMTLPAGPPRPAPKTARCPACRRAACHASFACRRMFHLDPHGDVRAAQARGRATAHPIAVGGGRSDEGHQVKTQSIELDHGTLRVQTDAYVFGEWAAHVTPVAEGDGWRVSHVPSGVGTHGLCDGLSKNDAVRVARELDRRVRELAVTRKALRGGGFRIWIPHDEKNIIAATFAEVLGA